MRQAPPPRRQPQRRPNRPVNRPYQQPPRRRRSRTRSRLGALIAFGAAVAVVVIALTTLVPGGHGTDTIGATTGPGGPTAPSTSTTTVRDTTSTSTTAPKPPPRRIVVPVGTYPVGHTSVTLDEPSAASVATTTLAGHPIRVLPTTIRYPLAPAGAGQRSHSPDYADGPFPLVVFSQGFDISGSAYAKLLNQWASAGYVVAAPVYPLTDPTRPGGVSESDIVNHPADLQYVIARLRAMAGKPGNRLHGLIDPKRVGIAGHSDGGDVSLAVAADSCCRDPAVRAAAILSGAELAGFGGTYYSQGNVPLLVVQGDDDNINVPGCSVQLYDQAQPPKYFLNIHGAGHEEPYMDPGKWRSAVITSVVAFFNSYLKHRAGGLRALANGKSLPGGETLTTVSTLPNEAAPVCPGAP